MGLWPFRRRLRDVLDELDRFITQIERDIEHTVDEIQRRGEAIAGKPHVYGIAFNLSEGRPEVRTFGDLATREGHRIPYYEQIVEGEKGQLRLVVELPGVQRDEIGLKASENRVLLSTRGSRLYRAEVTLREEVEPSKTGATFKNGLLEVVFQLRKKPRPGFTDVKVE